MITNNKNKAIIGTILFHIVLLLCFIFLGLTYQIPPPEEEGITINFGYQDFGSGVDEPKPTVEEKKIHNQKIINNNPVIEEISTQDLEETTNSKPKDKLDKNKELKIIADEKPETEVNIKALYAAKNQNRSNSQGIREKQEDQGKKDGNKTSNEYNGLSNLTNGIAYQLVGRAIAEIKKPTYDSQQQGKVVVTIRVNRKGNVISAIAGTKGSTTTNSYLYAKAKEAALKTTFEAKMDAPEIQLGKIIYNFKLN